MQHLNAINDNKKSEYLIIVCTGCTETCPHRHRCVTKLSQLCLLYKKMDLSLCISNMSTLDFITKK